MDLLCIFEGGGLFFLVKEFDSVLVVLRMLLLGFVGFCRILWFSQ